MATEHIETVITRLTHNKAFRVKYCQDPDRTLESYLSPEEIRVLKTGDGHKLMAMGAGDSWEAFTLDLGVQSPAD